jgi:ribonucleotide reductase alpha subunit
VDDIVDAYIEAWRLGLKIVAIYRDGSKARSAAQFGDVERRQAVRPCRGARGVYGKPGPLHPARDYLSEAMFRFKPFLPGTGDVQRRSAGRRACTGEKCWALE